MKNTTFFLLVMILWVTLANGQILLPRNAALSKLPVGVQPSKSLHKFLTQEAPLTDISSVTTDEEIQLDSAVLMLASDAGGGNVIVVPFSKKAYQYPNDRIIMETVSNQENGKWMPIERTQQRYDDQGRLFAVLAESFDPEFEIWSPDSRFIIHFHGSSETLADSMFVEGWSPDLNSWVRLLTIYHTFNNFDLVSESYSTIALDEEYELTFKDVYYYDEFGNNMLIESFLLEGEEIIPSDREENTFVFNYLISTTISTADGLGGFIPESKITYTYSGQGIVDSISTYQYLPLVDEWSLAEAVYYGFDDERRISKQEQIILEFESITEHEIITYEYLHDDYLLAENLYLVDVESGVQYLNQRTRYYYSTFSTSAPIPARFETLAISPNPTQHRLELSVSEATSLRIFDITGRLVRLQPVSVGKNEIDVAAFQPGTYTLVLQDRHRVYCGKVIKL